jgi:hypothetical protein
MALLTMPIPLSIGHLVTPRPNDIQVTKKTADGPPDNAYAGFYWSFGHTRANYIQGKKNS